MLIGWKSVGSWLGAYITVGICSLIISSHNESTKDPRGQNAIEISHLNICGPVKNCIHEACYILRCIFQHLKENIILVLSDTHKIYANYTPWFMAYFQRISVTYTFFFLQILLSSNPNYLALRFKPLSFHHAFGTRS